MSKERQHRRAILVRCKHCDKITTMEWERTTADEFNSTMVSDLGQNSPLETVSQQKRLAPLHKIKESLKRLKDETGYGIPEKGEKDDEETLRTDSGNNTTQNKPRRVDDIQGPPSIGLMPGNVG